MTAKDKKPLLIVICGPSGTGKTSLCDKLLAERDDVVYSISCTTRAPRGAEVDGEDYFFLSEESFAAQAAENQFIESATVHSHKYGTLKGVLYDAMAENMHILMDIDVQGVEQIREFVGGVEDSDPLKAGFVDIFVSPPSISALNERLVARGEDAPEVIEERLQNAAEEMEHAKEFKYIVVNDNLDDAYLQLIEIVQEEERM